MVAGRAPGAVGTLTAAGTERLSSARDAVAIISRDLVTRLGRKADRELRELLAKLLGC